MDLTSLDGTNGFEMDVAQYYHLSVLAVDSAGDVNGDGYDDVIAGWASWGSFWSGESYIVFGKASGFPASIDLMNLNGTDGYQLEGIDSSDWSGYSVSRAGDVNGDGYDDVVLGAVQASPNSNLYAGESYVVFGKASGYTATFDLATLDGTNGFQLNGIDASDFSGFDVSGGGDINGDGFSDVIIGAYEADPNGDSEAGETYVVFGKASGFSAAIDLSTLDGSDGFRLDGIDALDESGRAVSHAGDVNDDGFDDLIIGAWAATVGSVQYAGESYVVFGKASGFPAVFDLSSTNGTNGFRVDGIAAGDISGVEVSFAGDVNGDNTDDFLIGASGVTIASPWTVDAGETYVVFGVSGGSSDATYFVHTDHLGTPQAMTDAAQATAWKADYEPFGEATLTVSTAELNLRFPGQYFDSESGAHYNYFRDYDAVVGRYLQSDPIGLAGGINTYAYALNNPVKNTDPTGLIIGTILPTPPGGSPSALPDYGPCRYYERRCNETGCFYYCNTAPFVCRTAEINPLFIGIPTSDLNCIRKCLVREDQEAQGPCGGQGCLPNEIIDNYHQGCFLECGVPPTRYPGVDPWWFPNTNP